MKNFKVFMAIVLSASMLFSCKSLNNTAKGGMIGTGAGALVGAGIGKLAGNTAVGAIIGAAVGGTTGVLIGHYMDKQVKELQNDLKGAKVERVGEGIKITFDSGLLFPVNSSTLSGQSQANLNDLATILNKYKDTNILIEGHTDNTGKAEYNQALSERRANSVASTLINQNVVPSRITTKGYGMTQPIVDNNSEANRALNRRVEVAIFANDKLKKAAEKGQLGPVQ
ncbi:MAG: OmpA family protein [Bacteroidota bacterium]|nr:OmpA family protein [Bacteroidota bacterium]MDP4206106.1 OmpA family protein [Bacteroidota bacterium]